MIPCQWSGWSVPRIGRGAVRISRSLGTNGAGRPRPVPRA
jgi:hypothetical protein